MAFIFPIGLFCPILILFHFTLFLDVYFLSNERERESVGFGGCVGVEELREVWKGKIIIRI